MRVLPYTIAPDTYSGAVMVFVDVSSLKEARDRYARMFETMGQGVVYQDRDGAIVTANPAAQSILGLTMDEMQGRTSADPRWRAMREDGSEFPGSEHPSMVALRTGETVVDVPMGVYSPKAEATRWLEVTAVPLRNPGEVEPFQVYTTFTDVTERRTAQRGLSRALERLEMALEVTGAAWWEWEVATGRVVASKGKLSMVGADPQETESTLEYWTERLHPEDRDGAMEAMRRCLDGSTPVYEVEYRLRHDDGCWCRCRDHGRVAERDPEGRPLRVIGTVQTVEAPRE